MWCTVNKPREEAPFENAYSDINADTFSRYFASLSYSSNYIEPKHKLSTPYSNNYIASYSVYHLFTKSCPKKQIVSQTGFSNLFPLQSVSLCRPSTTTASNGHSSQLSGKIVFVSLFKKNNPTQSMSPHLHYPYSFTNKKKHR